MGWTAKQIGTLAAGAVLLAVTLLLPATARADFGVASFSAAATNPDGSPDLIAGSHPFAYTFEFEMSSDADGRPEGQLAGLAVELPPGMIGNPRAVPQCRRADFEGAPQCSPETQVGVLQATATALGGDVTAAVYNLVSPPGYAASFGVAIQGKTVIEGLKLVGSGSSAHLRVTTLILPANLGIKRVSQTLWGVPADQGHDEQRGKCLEDGGTCPAALTPAPLLSLPSSCREPLGTTLGVRSVEVPGSTVVATTVTEESGQPQALRDCKSLPFKPSFSLGTEGAALAPTGLRLDLDLPANEVAFGRGSATLDRLSLELPPGLTLNPPAADGLAACAPAQIGLESAPGTAPLFSVSAPACPGASRIGTATVEAPMLDHPLEGAIYLASPVQNPFGDLFAIYVVLDDPASGTLIKLPFRLDPDAGDGQIEIAAEGFPQLPLGHLRLELSDGPRALLTTPPACGAFTTNAVLLPSSAPDRAAARLSSSFKLERAASGPCPTGTAPNDPTLEAGTGEARAGARTSFVLRLRRADDSQRLSSLEATLPPGLVAKLAGVAVCSDAAASACPDSSAVGSIRVGAGVGPSPLYLSGAAYLGGPYRGAPFSLLISVPARVGPFDLGTIAVRAALRVNRTTGQIGIDSDPFPQILDGVPLNLRSLSLTLDRPGFIRNPTSCEPMTIDAAATSILGQVAPLSSPFEVGDCAALAFKPMLSVRLLGSTARGAHPPVKAILRSRAGSANLKRVDVVLPGSVLLDSKRIRAVCGLPAAEIGDCPAAAKVARLEVRTPLLSTPLRGPVFLRPSRQRLPGLTAVLDGAVQLRLSGHLGSRQGRLQFGFDHLPDVPFDSLTLRVAGGKRGILVNSGGVCRGPGRLRATLNAQSGRALDLSPRLAADCSGRRR